MTGARSERIDALRGLAVFGIMLVNVFSVVNGFGTYRYGTLDPAMSAADQWSIFLVASFAEQKFYPIFSFLFGAGFALQTGRTRQPGAGLDTARHTYQRRMQWLLMCGLIHGALIWFGDILTSYALVGFWLMTQTGNKLSSLLSTLRILVVVNGVVSLFYWMLVAANTNLPLADEMDFILAELRDRAIYTDGSWTDIAGLRLRDYLANLAGLVLFFPRLMFLFLLGAIAVRLGWVLRPDRHRRAWLTVLLAGLAVGLPLNLWSGAVTVAAVADPIAQGATATLVAIVAELAGPCLAASYIAVAMLAPTWVLGWLAPVGRMALTNYLMQSVLLTCLLQGFGLGLGARLSPVELVALCATIMLLQLALSYWWLASHAQGPVEAIWRRYTGKFKSQNPG